ncbi:hypothetical protein BST91_03970 [Nonlabens tegetincola]|uniref:hypothetical protein n=1 Tax=Nonlabens tegetincola TaxID=323273 RepID=UPI000A206A0B|nr:hypothetical protein [Nonlabens tegetincola]ARN70863.1 hypothetical protein BST91_03970 [Nonlabens tegetincola]
MPSESEIKKAEILYQTMDLIKASVVINVNGWLGSGRGMKTALRLCENLKDKDVAFILAGKLDCPEAEIISKKPNVQYIGQVSNSKALATYLASDFVFTYYDPNSVVNTLAASNKWGDALKMGIGVIVNSEVITANYLDQAGVTITYNYQDSTSLTHKICELLDNPDSIKKIKSNSRNLSTKFGYFEDQLNNLFYEAE